MAENPKPEIIVNVETILPVIINNNTFENPKVKKRDGSKQDVDSLKKFCSEQLNSKVIITIEDKTKESIFSDVRSIELRDNSGFNALMVFIMSHGDEGGIISAYDVNYQLQDILGEFNNLSHFKDKLKFFFVQACRGVNSDAEEYQHVKDGPLKRKYEECKDTKIHPLIMVDQYTLLGFSTVEGNVSNRSTEAGAIYIQSLIEIFPQFYDQEKVDLKEWLTAVNDEVCKKSELFYKDKNSTVVPDIKNFDSTNTDNLQYQSPIFGSYIGKKVFLKKVNKPKTSDVATSSKNSDSYEGASSVYEKDGRGKVKPLIREPYSQNISNCIIFYEDNDIFSKEVEFIEKKFKENCKFKCGESCNSTCQHMEFKKVKMNAETLLKDLDTQMTQVNSGEGVLVVFIAEVIYPKASRVTDYAERRMVEGRTENNQTESDIKLKYKGGEIKISEIVGIIKGFYPRPKIIKFLDPTDIIEHDNISSEIQIDVDSHYMVPIIDHINADVLLFVGQKKGIGKQLFEKFHEDSDVVDIIHESSIMELNHSSRKNKPFYFTSLRRPVYLNPKLSKNGLNSDEDNIIRICQEISNLCEDKTILTDESMEKLKSDFNSRLDEMLEYKNRNTVRYFNLKYNEAQEKIDKKKRSNIFDCTKFSGLRPHPISGERIKDFGPKFQLQSIFFLLLSLYKKGTKCEISCENLEYGLFDDLIIETEESLICICFKIRRNKTELSVEELFSTTRSNLFDIYRYFSQFAYNFDQFKENGKRLNLIFWTNVPIGDLRQMMFEEPVEELFNVHKLEPSKLENIIPQRHLRYYKRTVREPIDTPIESVIERFERHLCFAFNQDTREELENKIKNLISELIDANNCEEIYDTITGQLTKWLTPNLDEEGTVLTHVSIKNYFDAFKSRIPYN